MRFWGSKQASTLAFSVGPEGGGSGQGEDGERATRESQQHQGARTLSALSCVSLTREDGAEGAKYMLQWCCRMSRCDTADSFLLRGLRFRVQGSGTGVQG